jgi:putative ABC transport system permease protein
MVGYLLRKMWRDMRRSTMTYGLCVLIVAAGFCGYCVLSISADQLAQSRDYFFEVSSFSEVFADLQQAPLSITRQLTAIEGVAQAEGRLVHTARVAKLEGEAELQLFSVGQGKLNAPLLSRGALPRSGERQIAVGDKFFSARSLALGDTLKLVFSGQQVPFHITGSGISPETIYMIKSVNDLLPDPGGYDAGYIDYLTLSRLTSMEGSANNFIMTLDPGVSLDDVKDSIERVLNPYGLYSVYDRSGQVSASMLEEELRGIDSMAEVIPFLFLSVAAVILYIALHRLIEQQRTQAGILMALGISHRNIRRHYMGFGLAIGLTGGFIGGLAGNLLAAPMTDYYRTYFTLPEVYVPVSAEYLLWGTVMSAAFCAAVAWVCARSLGQLLPVEALRPAAPKSARISVLERIPRFTGLFTVPGLMAVRGLARNRRRTALSLFGMASAFMITASLVSMSTLFDVFIFDSLEKTQRQDIAVHFSGPVAAADALRAVRDPDIIRVEGIVELPAKLRSASASRDCLLQGIDQNAALTILTDEQGGRVEVASGGIVLSRLMADSLDVGIGDTIELETAYPRALTSRVAVTGIAAQYMGSTVYMSHEGVSRVSDYGGVYTSMLLKAPIQVQQRIVQRLDGASSVLGVESRAQRLAMYRSMMGSITGMMASMAAMGVLVGLAVIYTGSLISFEELKQQIATMMTLGLTSRQCLDVISTGQWILSIGAILLGIPLTMGVGRLMSASFSSDMYILPDFVDATSLAIAAGLMWIAVALGSWAMLRKLNKLSPVELLRERE